MDTLRLALIGFGNVGQGFIQLLQERGNALYCQLGVQLKVVAVCDIVQGSVYDPEGLDLAALLQSNQVDHSFARLQTSVPDWDALEMIQHSNAHIIIEVSPTNLETAEPAFTYICSAIQRRCHIVTTNKGPIALYYRELKALANDYDVELRFEGTVMSGTPVFNFARHPLLGTHIKRIEGIVNGTTNYILTQMTQGMNYATALSDAQSWGYAEANPTSDVEGYDAVAKMVILANVFMNAHLSPTHVHRRGITHLTNEDIQIAQERQQVYKLVGRLYYDDEGAIKASVEPTALPMNNPLASIGGTTNALSITTDVLENVMIIGPGAGRRETGQAILSDVLAIGHTTTRTPRNTGRTPLTGEKVRRT